MKSLGRRIKKLEEKYQSDEVDIVVFIDDVANYQGKTYKQEEFYQLFPDFKNSVVVEIE